MDKNEYKNNNNIFNNFFYIYYNETSQNDIKEKNKNIKNYIFIPFFTVCAIFYTIILIRVFFKFNTKKKEEKSNEHHNINNLKIGLVYDEEDDINNVISSSVAASIDD